MQFKLTRAQGDGKSLFLNDIEDWRAFFGKYLSDVGCARSMEGVMSTYKGTRLEEMEVDPECFQYKAE